MTYETLLIGADGLAESFSDIEPDMADHHHAELPVHDWKAALNRFAIQFGPDD